MDLINHVYFHAFVRWGLGIHGVIHVAETIANIYESAWLSALLSAFAGFLMLSGACIDYTHHRKDHEPG